MALYDPHWGEEVEENGYQHIGNGPVQYLFSDHLGSTALVTNSNMGLISEIRYNPWGGVRATIGTPAAGNAFTYTGQRQDSYINLLWYGSRWYDPYLNQFLTPDSIVPDPYNPIDYDRYTYVRNNPINYNDPTGHCTSGHKACLAKLEEVQKLFDVNINDKYQAWTLDGLSAIQNGMQALLDKMGKKEFFEQFTGVTFFIETGNGMWTTGNKDIIVGDKIQNDNNYVTKYTVHELAHIGDNNCGDCLSIGMMNATGSSQESIYWLLNFDKGLYFTTELTNYYPKGQVPTNNSKNNRREDWADSVMAIVLPQTAEFNYWDQYRIDFVNKAIAGSK